LTPAVRAIIFSCVGIFFLQLFVDLTTPFGMSDWESKLRDP
jgi:hypothetical protein